MAWLQGIKMYNLLRNAFVRKSLEKEEVDSSNVKGQQNPDYCHDLGMENPPGSRHSNRQSQEDPVSFFLRHFIKILRDAVEANHSESRKSALSC